MNSLILIGASFFVGVILLLFIGRWFDKRAIKNLGRLNEKFNAEKREKAYEIIEERKSNDVKNKYDHMSDDDLNRLHDKQGNLRG